jgi:putative Holliday junction resolvase
MRVLSLDVGERYIGIAISDPTGTVARPLQTLVRGSREEDVSALTALVTEHSAELVVVGRPLSLDGTEGPQARRVARYARALAAHLPVPVVSWDERFTTVRANEILLQSRGKKRRRRARATGEIDAVAAAVILQDYLDKHYLDKHHTG